MPEDNPKEGVNVVAEVSPTPAAPVATVEPPAESTSVQSEPENKGHVPYARFKEVNDKMRSYESELAKLRSEKTGKPQDVPSEDASTESEEDEMSKYEKRLKEEGIDEKVAKPLSKVLKEMVKDRSRKESEKAKAVSDAKLAEEKTRLAKSTADIKTWQENLKKAHPDYAELEPKMQERWDSLDEAGRMALVASEKSFELLYDSVKGASADSIKDEGRQEGRQEAYGTRSLKTALSSVPGTAANPGKKYTPEDVGSMSTEKYAANRDKILKDLGYQ
jgi:hypothetical protein